MPKQDNQFNGKRIIGEKKSKHMNIASESMSNDSDTEMMREILNTNTESKNDMFLPMKQQMMGQQQMPMMGQMMPMMGQQQMNMADVDPIMVNTLAPINNMGMNQMNMGNLMSGSQMAQGLGNLGKLGQSGLNIPQSFELSEAAPMGMQMPMMGQQNMQMPMMGQQQMQMPMMGQQNMMDPNMLKNIAGLNQMKMI